MYKFPCKCGASLERPDDNAKVTCPECGCIWDVLWHAENHVEYREAVAPKVTQVVYEKTMPLAKMLALHVAINVTVLIIAKLVGFV